eukprot:2037639-Pleurochrysis_carterae.AAC.2
MDCSTATRGKDAYATNKRSSGLGDNAGPNATIIDEDVQIVSQCVGLVREVLPHACLQGIFFLHEELRSALRLCKRQLR